MMAQRVGKELVMQLNVSYRLPVYFNYSLAIRIFRSIKPVIFSKDYALNWHWFLTFSFDLVNIYLW